MHTRTHMCVQVYKNHSMHQCQKINFRCWCLYSTMCSKTQGQVDRLTQKVILTISRDHISALNEGMVNNNTNTRLQSHWKLVESELSLLVSSDLESSFAKWEVEAIWSFMINTMFDAPYFQLTRSFQWFLIFSPFIWILLCVLVLHSFFVLVCQASASWSHF